MSTLPGTSDAKFLYPCLKNCAFHPKSSALAPLGSADDSVRILGKRESKDPEFQKEYLKLVGEEPTSVLPNDMEKLVREPPRYTEIVALFKRISDECMIVRPCNSPCLEIFMQAAYRLPAQGLDSARPMREESEAAYP
jgi:hypothetical protein